MGISFTLKLIQVSTLTVTPFGTPKPVTVTDVTVVTVSGKTCIVIIAIHVVILAGITSPVRGITSGNVWSAEGICLELRCINLCLRYRAYQLI